MCIRDRHGRATSRYVDARLAGPSYDRAAPAAAAARAAYALVPERGQQRVPGFVGLLARLGLWPVQVWLGQPEQRKQRQQAGGLLSRPARQFLLQREKQYQVSSSSLAFSENSNTTIFVCLVHRVGCIARATKSFFQGNKVSSKLSRSSRTRKLPLSQRLTTRSWSR